jgi:putative phage-type endonuclease
MSKSFKNRLCEWIDLVDKWQPVPTDEAQVEHWGETALELAYSYEFAEGDEETAVHAIVDAWTAAWLRDLKESSFTPLTRGEMDALCSREQIEQRTPAWYAQSASVVSASELSTLFGSPRARAQLVMSKVNPAAPRTQTHACATERMGPFDWGIRFEPVVKQIYCHRYNATIKELGRLTDLEYPRVTASPDGLVYDGPRAGRLVEIKCPVTREPDGSIPHEYYMQMQLQMRVTGAEACDYIEVQFNSPYSKEIPRIGPGIWAGEIALVYNTETTGMRYEYGPIGGTVEPVLGEGEVLLERIPWSVYSWHEQIVRRSPEWWTSVKPVIDAFWKDVDLAREGKFVVPESRRVAAAVTPAQCNIILPGGDL